MSSLKLNQYMMYFRILVGFGSMALFFRLLRYVSIGKAFLILIGINFIIALPVEMWYWKKTGLAEMISAQRVILVHQWHNVKKAWHERKALKRENNK